MSKRDDRCGVCSNCIKLERARESMLACCNPPFTHADDGLVKAWNDAVRDFKCKGAPMVLVEGFPTGLSTTMHRQRAIRLALFTGCMVRVQDGGKSEHWTLTKPNGQRLEITAHGNTGDGGWLQVEE